MTRMTWAAGMTMAIVLAGCATPDTVMMRNPKTKELARCTAGYRAFIDGQGYRSQEECVADYQQKGYETTGSTAGK